MIDSSIILVHDLLPAFAISFFDGLFNVFDRFIWRENAADREEAGLQNCINPSAHPRGFGNPVTIHNIEFEPLTDNMFFCLAGKMIPYFFWAVGAIKEERASWGSPLENVQSF